MIYTIQKREKIKLAGFSEMSKRSYWGNLEPNIENFTENDLKMGISVENLSKDFHTLKTPLRTHTYQ